MVAAKIAKYLDGFGLLSLLIIWVLITLSKGLRNQDRSNYPPLLGAQSQFRLSTPAWCLVTVL